MCVSKKSLSQSIKIITSTHGDHNSCASVGVSYQGIPLNSTPKINTYETGTSFTRSSPYFPSNLDW